MSTTSLQYLSQRPINIAPDSHVVLSVVRNETLRLPYFLAYYRKLGFDRFIFVDNASTDSTRQFLLDQPDTAVFYTEESFGAPPGAGLRWKNWLLDKFCDGRWVLVADADEILIWPGSEKESIQSLTAKFGRVGAEVLFTLMLDMYSDKPFGEIGYRAGQPFAEHASYFDRGPYVVFPMQSFPFRYVQGGVRGRLYRSAGAGFSPPVMSKVAFVKWHAGQRFIMAQHALVTPAPLAPMQGALLHFKMLDDFLFKCETEIERGQHFDKSRDYRVLDTAYRNSVSKSFFDPAFSVRYENTDQLCALKLMIPLRLPSLNTAV